MLNKSKFTVKSIQGHIEVCKDGVFAFSADTISEAMKMIIDEESKGEVA